MPPKTSTARPKGMSASPRDPLALEEQVCFALAVANRSVLRLYRPVLEPLGLTHPQYLVMLALWQHAPASGAPKTKQLSVKELGLLLQLDSGTLSPLIKRLEVNGLVVRERDPDDERSVTVSLTSQGRSLRAEALRVPEDVVRALGLQLADLRRLQVDLTRLIAAAGAAAPPLGD